MNEALERQAAEIGLSNSDKEKLRLAFAYACVSRVRHLLEDTRVSRCLDILGRYLQGQVDHAALMQASNEAARLANQHQASKC